MKHYTIGRAARSANVNVETIRFYERKGLITQPQKPAGGGLRDYGGEIVARVKFIRQAQEIGFSLAEIAELLSLRTDPGAGCADVRERAIRKQNDVKAKLERLLRIDHALDALIARCPGAGSVQSCTILDLIERGIDGDQNADQGAGPAAS